MVFKSERQSCLRERRNSNSEKESKKRYKRKTCKRLVRDSDCLADDRHDEQRGNRGLYSIFPLTFKHVGSGSTRQLSPREENYRGQSPIRKDLIQGYSVPEGAAVDPTNRPCTGNGPLCPASGLSGLLSMSPCRTHTWIGQTNRELKMQEEPIMIHVADREPWQ